MASFIIIWSFFTGPLQTIYKMILLRDHLCEMDCFMVGFSIASLGL